MSVAALPKLSPLSTGQLLDQAIQLYRRNFLKFIGIIAAVQVPISLFQMLLLLSVQGEAVPAGDVSLINLIVFVVEGILVQGVATAALTRAVADQYLGRKTGLMDAYSRIGRSWLSVIGALVMAILLSIGLGLLLFVSALVPLIGQCASMICGFGFVLGLLIYLWLVITPLIAPVVVLEKQGAWGAIRRAWELARRRFWWLLGFIVVLYIFNLVVVSGPQLLINILLGLSVDELLESQSAVTVNATRLVIQALVGLALSLIYLPLRLSATTLMYFDLRVRLEGFDLALLAESALSAEADVGEVMTRTPRAESQSLITGKEVAYFVLLSICVIPLYFVVVFFLALLMFGGL